MSTVKFSCGIAPSNADAVLGVEIWIDQDLVIDIDHVAQAQTIEHQFDDNEAKRVLRIVLKNKLPEHTTVDEQGNIVTDSTVTIENINMDGVVIDNAVHKLAQYWNDRNGTQTRHMDRFYGVMGCNGVVHFEFTTPTYQWLLDNV